MNTKIYALTALSICIGLLLTGFPAATGQLETTVTLSVSGIIQQTTTETYSYIINVSGINYQMIDGNTGQISFKSTNATQIINNALGNLTQNGSILLSTGTYTLNGSITGINKDNITLIFENGAKLFVTNGMNTPAIVLTRCTNWLIKNPTIDGNAANQVIGVAPYGVHGIAIYDRCSSIHVDGANIYNVRMFGFSAWHDVTNVGITNSKLFNCGWNGIQLGNDDDNSETSLYAIGNEVAFSGDVGITAYGASDSIIEGNNVHDMNGTTGSVNSQWGIAVEFGYNNKITSNNITNCPRAIALENQGSSSIGSNIIEGNTISYCGFGIVVTSPNNQIKNNTITNFDMLGVGQQAIAVNGNYGGANNNQVLNNTISSVYGVAHSMCIVSASYTQVASNRIIVPRTESSWFSIQISGTSTYTQIAQNTIIGYMGVIVEGASCQFTSINDNDLTQCNAEGNVIVDNGTSTIIYGNLGYN